MGLGTAAGPVRSGSVVLRALPAPQSVPARARAHLHAVLSGKKNPNCMDLNVQFFLTIFRLSDLRS